METVKIKYKDGTEVEKTLVNSKTDNCPLCDTPLSQVGFSWRVFHGEASSSCCGAIYQLKSYHVDEEKWGKEAKDYAESLDTREPHMIESKIDGEYLVAYRKAFAETGIKKVGDAKVQKRVGELLAPIK